MSEVASDREAALLASRENAAGRIAGARLSDDPGVNVDPDRPRPAREHEHLGRFRRLLHREGASVFPFRPDWHRFAAFVVLKAPDIPSILFESGYLTNAVDARYISSEQGRRQMAEGMRRAIEAHFARRLVLAARE